MDIKWNVQDKWIKGYTKNADLNNNKIAAFDLDDTLVKPKNGKKFSESDDDWEVYDKSIPNKLTKLVADGYSLVIISNQKGIGSGKVNAETWKNKIKNIVNFFGLNFIILCSLNDDMYRKPRTKLWEFINGDINTSFYCGDAGGLLKRKINNIIIDKDFADSDLKFALNVGIKFIHRDEFVYNLKYTNDTYKINYVDFTKIPQKKHTFEENTPEVIINIGLPASGKSTYTTNLIIKNNPQYVYINQDLLKTVKKCSDALETALKNGQSAVIDNTNVSKANRKVFIDIAKKYKVQCRCLLFNTNIDICVHNSSYRNFVTNGNVNIIPKMVYNIMNKKYEKPELNEGFYEINEIEFMIVFDNDNDRKTYQMYYS